MKPIVLAILDGWGVSPVWGGNAIEMNSPSNFNRLWRTYPHLVLRSFFASYTSRGSNANSEIGHMMIGSGREIMSDCELIDREVGKPEFFTNPELLSTIDYAGRFNSDIHLVGMISEGCIHSSLTHLIALLRFYKRNGFTRVYIHAITDGRDVEEVSASIFLDKLLAEIRTLGIGKIASICGRFYAMDRDNHWDRTELFYTSLIGQKITAKAMDPKQAIHQAYVKQISDEFIPPTSIYENNFPVGIIKNNDAVVLFNFRSDRIRQLVLALTGSKRFSWFAKQPMNLKITSILKYHFSEYQNKNIQPVFPEAEIKGSLSQILSEHYIPFLKVAETEKLAHVTYFFNGGIDKPYPGEDRSIVKSADVQSFIKDPSMKSAQITEIIKNAVLKQHYKLIVVNYANIDEVAHTGDILATSKAVEAVDTALFELGELVNQDKITLIVTADHGNGEQMVNREHLNEPETFHTMNPVPFIFADKSYQAAFNQQDDTGPLDLLTLIAQSKYSLKEIAPTILEMLNIPKPAEMTGQSLLGILNLSRKVNESTS